MLKFARNKLVNVHFQKPDTLLVHGVLDDDIYSLEVNVEIRLPDLVFSKIAGKWHRWTTPECPRSQAYFKEAEGLRIDDAIEQKLQKGVGRKGCRHFATIMIECCKSVRETLQILGWEAAVKTHPDLTFSDFLKNPDAYRPADGPLIQVASGPPPSEASEGRPAPSAPEAAKPASGRIRKSGGGFVVDLHTHSFPASTCATDSVDKMIQEARTIGLDGICITDHNFLWMPDDLEKLRQKHGYLIVGGNEMTTDQGHMVAFGLDKPMGGAGIIKLEDLQRAVAEADGFLIVAHPFRGFLTFGVGKLGLTVEKAAERPLFRMVNAVEILNGKVTSEENGFAEQVAAHLKLPVTGGSDAHDISEVGCYATEFEKPFHDEAGLLDALKNGRYQAISFRGGIGQ